MALLDMVAGFVTLPSERTLYATTQTILKLKLDIRWKLIVQSPLCLKVKRFVLLSKIKESLVYTTSIQVKLLDFTTVNQPPIKRLRKLRIANS